MLKLYHITIVNCRWTIIRTGNRKQAKTHPLRGSGICQPICKLQTLFGLWCPIGKQRAQSFHVRAGSERHRKALPRQNRSVPVHLYFCEALGGVKSELVVCSVALYGNQGKAKFCLKSTKTEVATWRQSFDIFSSKSFRGFFFVKIQKWCIISACTVDVQVSLEKKNLLSVNFYWHSLITLNICSDSGFLS